MNREYHSWCSHRLGRDMEPLIFGHAGAKVLVFLTRDGRFHEYEDLRLASADDGPAFVVCGAPLLLDNIRFLIRRSDPCHSVQCVHICRDQAGSKRTGSPPSRAPACCSLKRRLRCTRSTTSLIPMRASASCAQSGWEAHPYRLCCRAWPLRKVSSGFERHRRSHFFRRAESAVRTPPAPHPKHS